MADLILDFNVKEKYYLQGFENDNNRNVCYLVVLPIWGTWRDFLCEYVRQLNFEDIVENDKLIVYGEFTVVS